MSNVLDILKKKNINHLVNDDGSIVVEGDLSLLGRTDITSLPEGLSVGGSLDLEGTGITSLPEGLPEGLSVGGSLYLRGTGITSLPEGLSCESLYLDPQRFDNVTYRDNCGNSSRTIFAAWVQGNFRIAAGCFWDTLDAFESAVDERYSGDAAETYKQAARDCVAELTVKLNKAGE
ncbi:hypothetical protein [Candidatus Symbiopectobacterium sp. NZEC151]|uniref:hypothetical protein n=1 Tax=Candidatus Symbiopectobacterium sp. NZEC151 TaxID=2820470 RepID=UPI002225E7DF|nr:hypothetical protein [Candidatus Symbiopectobacterium sp. NZEC151]MCW2473388.1 hypothetical protein [Candidatus Symbiopectobacterium sp. NZEC151]